MIAIIDYGAGNLRSIQRALETQNQATRITDNPDDLETVDAVVLPGVGNAGHAMDRLESTGFAAAITAAVQAQKPFLGICVGMQVLFDHQQEGDRPGLGLIPGRVRKIKGAEKLPHIGWNKSFEVSAEEKEASYFYFVHSYIAEPADQHDILASAQYGETFPSVVVRNNIWGSQFHPEKSGNAGLAFLDRWVSTFDSDERSPD